VLSRIRRTRARVQNYLHQLGKFRGGDGPARRILRGAELRTWNSSSSSRLGYDLVTDQQCRNHGDDRRCEARRVVVISATARKRSVRVKSRALKSSDRRQREEDGAIPRADKNGAVPPELLTRDSRSPDDRQGSSEGRGSPARRRLPAIDHRGSTNRKSANSEETTSTRKLGRRCIHSL